MPDGRCKRSTEDSRFAPAQAWPERRRQRPHAARRPRRRPRPPADADAPPTQPLADIRDDAAPCRRCPLWQRATQTVFGAGDGDAEIVLVGEQPGDQEDLAGEPFVGPAGQLLRKALDGVGPRPRDAST